MDAITAEKLAANAYRTLGLSASATQAEIEAAARKMRIWPDAAKIPPTNWDLPEIGPLRRGKPDIEQAVSALHQPASRLEHRIFWYFGDQPPGTKLTGQGINIADRHAVALRALQVAWQKAANDPALVHWASVLDRLVHVLSSEDLLNRQLEIESAGQFDKPATDREVATELASAPAAVASGMVRIAMNALDEGRLEIVGEIAAAIANTPAPAKGPHPRYQLLDRLEDQFTVRADRMEQLLRKNLRTNRQTPDPFFGANLKHANLAGEVYDKDVAPAISALLSAAATDSDRIARLKQRSAQLLILLALGWEWAGQYELSEQQLNEALRISAGTISEYQVKRELQRLADVVRQRKATAVKRKVKGFFGTGNSKRAIPAGLIPILIVISSLARFLTQSNTSSSANDPPTFTPQWQQQRESQAELDRIAQQLLEQQKLHPGDPAVAPWATPSPSAPTDNSRDVFAKPPEPSIQFPPGPIPAPIDVSKMNPMLPSMPKIVRPTWPGPPPVNVPPSGLNSSNRGGPRVGH